MGSIQESRNRAADEAARTDRMFNGHEVDFRTGTITTPEGEVSPIGSSDAAGKIPNAADRVEGQATAATRDSLRGQSAQPSESAMRIDVSAWADDLADMERGHADFDLSRVPAIPGYRRRNVPDPLGATIERAGRVVDQMDQDMADFKGQFLDATASAGYVYGQLADAGQIPQILGSVGSTIAGAASVTFDMMAPGSVHEGVLGLAGGWSFARGAGLALKYGPALPLLGKYLGGEVGFSLPKGGFTLGTEDASYLLRSPFALDVTGMQLNSGLPLKLQKPLISELPSGVGGTGANYDLLRGQGLYVLMNEAGEVKYFGRGDAPARLAVHEGSVDKGDLIGRVLWPNNLTKAQAKGLEQALMDNYGGALSQNPQTPLLNQYRSYAPDNPNAGLYQCAVTDGLFRTTLERLGLK